MSGRLISIVGPSGVGKDTVMTALADTGAVTLARRVITRDPSLGGEAFDAVSEAEFAARAARGAFLLHWQAHGLHYGIPATLRDDLAAGHDVLVNLSRAVLPDLRAAFPDAVIISLTAPTEVLAQRLAARGRESATDIAARLQRAGQSLPDGVNAIEVDNSGPLAETLATIQSHLSQRHPHDP